MLFKANGHWFNVERDGEGPAVVLLHGFTGSARNWAPVMEHMEGFTVYRVDLIGHGASDSPEEPERYSITRCIRDLEGLLVPQDVPADIVRTIRSEADIPAALARRIPKLPFALAGYSMGGRVAMRFALEHPERLWGLVLESASPGIEDETECAERVASDHALADRIEREGLESFVDYWQSLPMWASQESLPEVRQAELRRLRLQGSARGFANSLRGMGAGSDAPVVDKLAGLELPTLLIAGEHDAKYREVAKQMHGLLPNSELHIIDGAGHATHFEQPGEFAKRVSTFLRAHAPAATTGGLR